MPPRETMLCLGLFGLTVNDWTGIITAAAVIYLGWEQNQIFKRQNEIFALQAGHTAMPSDTSRMARFKRYWPTMVMAALMLLIGYDIYDRHLNVDYLTGSDLITGDAYYVNSSGVLTPAEANSPSTLPAVCVASSSTRCIYSGTITTGSWTAGGTLYLSDKSPGALTQTIPSTSGHCVQVMGTATSTTNILVKISPDWGGIK
jgi:hypothetical protein